MEQLDKTTRFESVAADFGDLQVTVFDATSQPYTVTLSSSGKPCMTFGRAQENDIVLVSHLVSRNHGRFVLYGGKWYIEDAGSTNGLIFNNANIRRKEIGDGEFIRIDDGVETVTNGVLFVFSAATSANKWIVKPIRGMEAITIGRDARSGIVLPHISVSKTHALIRREEGKFFIYDKSSANGVFVNGRRIFGRTLLHEKDVITITNNKLIFTAGAISYCCFKSGISVDTAGVVVERGKGKKKFITCNHVNLNIKPGELVAIIGGSGAGKSTLLNCMCGYLKPAKGEVYINGIDLYQNFESLQKIIGYVPQQDIVYDNLTLWDMLLYTAKMRLPKDISVAERDAAINRAIAMVELTEKKESFIKALSGGQRKRASIAVELLSDPNLLFLDEPASGLDPGTERNLMQSLREMADNGKTVILVTHSTLQLQMCDKVVFMGKGGNLCFCGTHDEALEFFKVPSIVDVYRLITDNAPYWRSEYAKLVTISGPKKIQNPSVRKAPVDHRNQLRVLCSRYMKLVFNDRQRLLLLLIQAPLLGFLIAMVANENLYETHMATKSIFFALSCSAFWIGILNAIQEICKERNILKREYMTGLSLRSYVMSKAIVLGVMCLIQSIMVSGVFAITVGMPKEGLFLPAYVEVLLSTFLTAMAAASMGLFVSSLFDNADRAMTVAPILLMPQILFSGIIFELKGASEIVSWIVACRWSMEALGTTANLNDLPNKIEYRGKEFEVDMAQDFFNYEIEHMLLVWGILLAFIVGFLVLAYFLLKKLGKEKS